MQIGIQLDSGHIQTRDGNTNTGHSRSQQNVMLESPNKSRTGSMTSRHPPAQVCRRKLVVLFSERQLWYLAPVFIERTSS